jgi:hypothetical protein
MPVTGNLPVATTEADIFISGNGGAVNDKCITQDNHFDVELAKDASSSSPHRRS